MEAGAQHDVAATNMTQDFNAIYESHIHVPRFKALLRVALQMARGDTRQLEADRAQSSLVHRTEVNKCVEQGAPQSLEVTWLLQGRKAF